MYCISCNRCPTILYIGEIGQSLRSRFGEHLQSIRNNTPGPTFQLHGPQLRVVKGLSRSRFTENKTVLSQFTKNKIGISRFTEKKGKAFFKQKLRTVII